jgi:rubrerythrin
LLALALGELRDDGFDLALTGFDGVELDVLFGAAAEPQAPDGFKDYDENIETEHQCPKCGYKWSGGKPGAADA